PDAIEGDVVAEPEERVLVRVAHERGYSDRPQPAQSAAPGNSERAARCQRGPAFEGRDADLHRRRSLPRLELVREEVGEEPAGDRSEQHADAERVPDERL